MGCFASIGGPPRDRAEEDRVAKGAKGAIVTSPRRYPRATFSGCCRRSRLCVVGVLTARASFRWLIELF